MGQWIGEAGAFGAERARAALARSEAGERRASEKRDTSAVESLPPTRSIAPGPGTFSCEAKAPARG